MSNDALIYVGGVLIGRMRGVDIPTVTRQINLMNYTESISGTCVKCGRNENETVLAINDEPHCSKQIKCADEKECKKYRDSMDIED